MCTIEDGLLAELKNFLDDLISDPEQRLHWEVYDEAKDLLEKLKKAIC